jgi:hypothetical protein
MISKPKFLEKFFQPEHFKPDICAKCASILSSCNPANPSSRCKMCLRKCPTALGSVALGSVASDSVSSDSVASDPATSDTDTSDTTTSENFAPTYESKSRK